MGKNQMDYNILVVDDEKELADVIELYLTGSGCTVYKCYTGAEALDCIAHTDLDLAILDVMLPDGDGFQICRKIREKSYFPIIMLTAKTADADKIAGLSSRYLKSCGKSTFPSLFPKRNGWRI